MNLSKNKPSLAYEQIEIQENKIILFCQKFWRFSEFYGRHLGSLHSKNK